MSSAHHQQWDCDEFVTQVRSHYCLLYTCIADREGVALAHLFHYLRRYWLAKFADQFKVRVARTRDPFFVDNFERLFGQVVANASGELVFRSSLTTTSTGGDTRRFDGILYDNTAGGRTVKRFFVMWAIRSEKSFREYLVPLPRGATSSSDSWHMQLHAADAALAKAYDALPSALTAFGNAALAQAEARLVSARADRAARLQSVPRCHLGSLRALLEVIKPAFADLMDGIDNYHVGTLMDRLDQTIVHHFPADPTMPLNLTMAEAAAEARRDAEARGRQAHLASARTQALLSAALALARKHHPSAAASFETLCVEIAAKHAEAERIESQVVPLSLARVNDTMEALDDALKLTTMLPP